MNPIKDQLGKAYERITVNSSSKDTSTVNSGNTVNGNPEDINTVNGNNSSHIRTKIQELLDDQNASTDDVAMMIADGLKDNKSLSYWKIMARENNVTILLETLHYVIDSARTKVIRNLPVYYIAILKAKGLKTKFKKF